MNRAILLLALAGILVLGVGCSQNESPTAPSVTSGDLGEKDGSENLGAPLIPISSGSAFVEGGVGVTAVGSGLLTVEVPQGPTIEQVLLYWSGASTVALGDDTIELDGVSVQGDLIGGPTLFYTSASGSYYSTAYRADITNLGAIQAGTNSITVSGFDFDPNPGTNQEDDGCSIVVILDDGTASELSLRDGLDMAFFGFQPTLDRTEPQIFAVTPATSARTADLMLIVASVGENRPSSVLVTTATTSQVFENVMNSNDGPTWDSLVLPVEIPAGESSVSVEIISTDSQIPLGASLGWVAAGLTVPLPAPAVEDISGTVFVDADQDGLQGPFELGIANVVVDVSDLGGFVTSVVTDAEGNYLFSLPAGTYTVSIDLTPGTTFNDDLVASFAPTTPTSLPVGNPATDVDFGFEPVADNILADLADGTLVSTGKTLDYWVKVFRKSILAENSGRVARGHDRNRRGGNGGWGHTENYPDADELRILVAQIADLYFPVPYQFTPGSELVEVLAVLRLRPSNEDEELYQELLVTELNYVSGRGLISETDRLGVLIGWGETLLLTAPAAKSGEKSRFDDVRNAISIFSAINTGGGGGVDE